MKRMILSLCLCVAAVARAQTPAPKRDKPSVSADTAADTANAQQAMAALHRMADFLATLKTFEITSASSRDEIVDGDMKIQKNALNTVTVRLPDRLYASIHGDDRDLQFFYDGQAVTLYSRNHNYYATKPAPSTVRTTLDTIQTRLNVTIPLADIIQMAAGENVLQEVSRAGYIGTSSIEGAVCDHVAVRQPNVDWQVWVERGSTPLPRKLVITSKTKPLQPQYTAVLTWNLMPRIDDELFTFVPPAGAVRIKFGNVNNTRREQ